MFETQRISKEELEYALEQMGERKEADVTIDEWSDTGLVRLSVKEEDESVE